MDYPKKYKTQELLMSQNTTNLKPTKNYLGGNNMTDKDRVRNDAGDGPPPTRYLPSNHNEDIHDFLGNVHSLSLIHI